jgi:transmembrane sensor
MDYKNYTVNDFVTDNNFQRWVKNPDEADLKFWKHWMAQNPDKKETLNAARRMVQLLDFEKNQPNQHAFEEVRVKIKDHIKTRRLITPNQNKTYKLPHHPLLWRKIAAVFVGVTVMGLLYYFFMTTQPNTYYATDFGEIQTITLPDGSQATLNGNSTLTISDNWEETREVWLKGEAFFEVKKIAEKSLQHQTAKGKKFLVHTHHLDVEVLGTTFNVNERRGITKVALNTGRVQLIKQSGEETTTLPMKPGELVEYEEANEQFQKHFVNPELMSVWKEDKFVFDGTSLQEIGNMLEDNYGFTVMIEDKNLAERKFTASLPSRDVDFLLSLISELLDIKVSKDENRITIENY